ncbi:MAG: putative N6-adenine-specific methylase [Clostridiales bacterium]|jgi:putative N6-adenine-specific DNA methylase|nr:putative N6-adenine-specific methylase [Clostridiales bacterium]MDK2933463.1 putative N6-adenine-specific methylase [Clostridiales bacterium]
MTQIEFIVPTLFGLEALAAKEIRELGYETTSVENGRVTFIGDEAAICRANLWLRTAERVLVKMGEFEATTYEQLFEQTKAVPWPDWIPENAKFPVKGYSLKSQLFSVPDCQSIIKKAVVEKMKEKYNTTWFQEDGPLYQIQFSLLKDKVTLMIDTSGDGLHKRGYREHANEAPLRETLAAAMVMLSVWKPEKAFLDPFCGSGTIPIEAALIGANIAPGLEREFVAQNWHRVPKELWWDARREAHDKMRKNIKFHIYGSDIDHKAVKLSRENVSLAGVGDYVIISNLPMNEIQSKDEYGCIICNPPYGERLGELKEIEKLYRQMGQIFKKFDTWSYYILTSYENFEKLFGRKANKKRKLYNGMIKCDLYQYYGPKPPKNNVE